MDLIQISSPELTEKIKTATVLLSDCLASLNLPCARKMLSILRNTSFQHSYWQVHGVHASC